MFLASLHLSFPSWENYFIEKEMQRKIVLFIAFNMLYQASQLGQKGKKRMIQPPVYREVLSSL